MSLEKEKRCECLAKETVASQQINRVMNSSDPGGVVVAFVLAPNVIGSQET